jgi:hypothetical protein
VAFALAAVVGAACIDDNIPPRPIAQAAAVDGGPEPIELATSSGCGSTRLVVVDGTVYWTEQGTGTVKSVPTTGGPTTVIAAGQSQAGALAVDDSSIFWVAGGGKTVMKKPLMGGSPEVFVKPTAVPEVWGDENDINALLVDRGYLFVGRFTFALKVPTEGGNPQVIAHSPDPDMGRPAAFAIDADHLYQTELKHVAISRETLDGQQMGVLEDHMTKQMLAPDRLAVSQDPLLMDAIALANGQVFWATRAEIRFHPVDQLETTLPETLLTASADTRDSITGFVISDGVVYFGPPNDNVVERAPLSTRVPEVIAQYQMSPHQFAADAGSIYWHTADCRVMKLAK